MELANIFPSKYVKSSDLKGREITVVIAEANIEKIGDDNKLVLYFQGKEKGLVTNRTNADRIAHTYGSNTDQWIGRELILFTDLVQFQGKMVEAIRVKPPAKAPLKHVVTEKKNYTLSEMRKPDPIEEATGHPTRDTDEDPIPF